MSCVLVMMMIAVEMNSWYLNQDHPVIHQGKNQRFIRQAKRFGDDDIWLFFNNIIKYSLKKSIASLPQCYRQKVYLYASKGLLNLSIVKYDSKVVFQ